MLGYFGRYTGELVFASPKINPAEYHGLMDCLDDINGVLAEFKLPYTTRLIANEDFKVHILEPVLHAMNNVADTSELFLRSLQLYNMFATKQPVSTAEAKSDGPRKITQSFESIEGSGIKGLGEMKVGAIARTVLRKTLESGRISESEIALLQTKEYSKEKFDIQFPLLRKASGKDEPKPNRYYDNPLNINGTYYFLCSEWIGKAPNNDLPYLLNCLALHTE